MSNRAAIQVIDPGMFTSVQDLGRPGWTHLGIPQGGACDTLSLRAGNRLVGNEDGAAALEMTLIGGTFEFLSDAILVLAGARVDGTIEGGGGTRSVAPWIPTTIRSGERLLTGPIRHGARCYVCVAGGINVPPVLESRSTYAAARFGGFEGRALRAGDQFHLGTPRGSISEQQIADRAGIFCETQLSRRAFRTTDGAHSDGFDTDARAQVWCSSFTVQSQSNRMGLRLDNKINSSVSGMKGGRMPSEGMMHGAVQIPESGLPIVLMPDHPTTGGYPVIACVSLVDHPALGQVVPMQTIRFERVTIEEARALYLEQERHFDLEVPRHE